MYVETEGPNAGLYYDTSGKGLCSDANCTDCQVPNDNKTPGPIVYDTQCRNMDFVGIGPGVLAPSWNFITGDCPVQPVTGSSVTYPASGPESFTRDTANSVWVSGNLFAPVLLSLIHI